MQGWNLDEYNELEDVLGDIYDTKYEIENCVRGCYTNCKTYAELSEHLRELSERLSLCADYLERKEDDFDDGENEDDES